MPASIPDAEPAAAAASARPAVHYWHIWADEHGVSHQTRCTLTAFERQSMSGAAPQWNDVLSTPAAKVLFTVLPVGWVGEWHENPRPQWIAPLSGCWFVESMDGTRIEMGAGDISFGGDQNCVADAQGRKGHRSGTVGGQPAVLMIVQLEQAPRQKGPCCFT